MLSATSIESPAKTNGQPVTTPTPVVAKTEPAKEPTTAKGIEKAALAKGLERKPTEAPVVVKPVEVVKPAVFAIPTIVAGSDPKNKGRFTLQISSFQDKKEAENFARKLEGEHPYLVQSDIPGKGVWFRVRLGDYASDKEAKTAKLSFERKFNLIAYVAQR
jgi:septal ring-binding cell division protein DamX